MFLRALFLVVNKTENSDWLCKIGALYFIDKNM